VVGPGQFALDNLALALRNRGLTTEVLATGERPGAAVIANAAARAAAHDYVVLLTRNADSIPAQRTLATQLAGTGTPLIAASVGRPYDAAFYDADAAFALYSVSVPSLRALAAVLFGEFKPTGKLPVAIPAAGDPDTTLFPFGFGLTYP
jgi:beta-N-acetylhexosaminidase